MRIRDKHILFYKPRNFAEGETHGGTCEKVPLGSGLNSLWDNVGTEDQIGATDYRKVFVGLDSEVYGNVLYKPVAYIDGPTLGVDWLELKIYQSDDQSNFASDVEGETTWVAVTELNEAITLPTVTVATPIAIWMRRVVPAGCPAYKDNSYSLRVRGKVEL